MAQHMSAAATRLGAGLRGCGADAHPPSPGGSQKGTFCLVFGTGTFSVHFLHASSSLTIAKLTHGIFIYAPGLHGLQAVPVPCEHASTTAPAQRQQLQAASGILINK